MAEPPHCPPSNPPDPGARLPALTQASRELMEVLWRAAIARAFPQRAGRKIQTVSTLLADLMAQGWVAGEKRGGPAGCTGPRCLAARG